MDDTQNNIPPTGSDSTEELPTTIPSDDSAKEMPEVAPSEAEAKCVEYLAGWQRANADYANLKRETERTQAEFAKFASAGVINALLPVIDSFKKAHAAFPAPAEGVAPDAAELVKWAEGIGAVKAQFDGILGRAGVKAIDAADVPFDPSMHEAMLMEKPADGVKPGTVLRVLEPGYKMHDRVLRPAKVVVAE